MRLQVATGFIVLLATNALGRVINSAPTSPGSSLQLDTRLIDTSAAPVGISDDLPGNLPDLFNPALGGDFDPQKWANQELWDKYVAKGHHLTCLMEATDRGAGWLSKDPREPPSAASRWTGDLRNELAQWNWQEAYYDKDWECNFEKEGLKEAFNGLGLDARPLWDDDGEKADGDNDCYALHHWEMESADPNDPWAEMVPILEQKYQVNGKEYTATGASYEFAINYVGGAIIAKNINSPRNAVQEKGIWGRKAEPGELPDLQYLSDVYWGYWARDNPDIKNFRVYGAHFVLNDDTVLLVARALRNKGKSALEKWPGVELERGTEEHLALIASPIGATAAHFLIAHKAELGIKWIAKVTVVMNGPSSDGSRPVKEELHLFFSIEDVPRDDVMEPGEDRKTGRVESNVLHVRDEGKHVLREHKVMANL